MVLRVTLNFVFRILIFSVFILLIFRIFKYFNFLPFKFVHCQISNFDVSKIPDANNFAYVNI